MSVIAIEGMEFFSYHGHFEEESIIGTHFIVDLYFHTDTSKAEISDNLEETVNYLSVYQIVKQQMQQNSYLLEHVARRILNSVLKEFQEIEKAEVKIQKLNPPLGGKIKSVSVHLKSEV